LQAANTAGLADDARTRYALRGYLEFGTLVAVRNSHTTSDAELHPCQEVPRWGW
jgi:hemoglobin